MSSKPAIISATCPLSTKSMELAIMISLIRASVSSSMPRMANK